MIIFTDNPNYAPIIQSRFNRPVVIYNLSSLYSGFIDATDLLTNLSSINYTGMPMPLFVESIEFDMQYMASIMNNPNLFNKLMMILSNSYEGCIVVLLVQRDPYRDSVMESLIKLIQQRYGYNCWIVEDPEDISCIKEDEYNTLGLITLDGDLKKYDSSYSEENRISIEF